jgi:hypothetical protein
MKKLLVFLSLLTLFAVTAARAQSINVLMNGNATNSIRIFSGTTNVVQNRFGSAGSFLTSATNLASIVTNITPVLTGSTVGVVAGAFSAGVSTNTYTFLGSYDKRAWDTITNVTLAIPAGTTNFANFTVGVGSYTYIQCSNVTNTTATLNTHNYLAIVQRQ